jgi:hypothetical protein
LRLVARLASGSGMPRSAPGLKRFANDMPSISDTSDAVMNHASALTVMRPRLQPHSNPMHDMLTARLARGHDRAQIPPGVRR